MTDNTEPTIDEILDNLACASHFLVDDKCIYCDDIKLKSLISDQVAKARIKELKLWQSYWKNGKDTRNTDSYVSDRIKELGE